MHTTRAFERELSTAMDSIPRRVIVDLRRCEFLDASGLKALLTTRDEHAEAELVLVVTDHCILKIFRITGLDRLFRIERTLSSARLAATHSLAPTGSQS